MKQSMQMHLSAFTITLLLHLLQTASHHFITVESKDKELAKYIQESMAENAPSMKDMGVRFGDYYVTRENNQRGCTS